MIKQELQLVKPDDNNRKLCDIKIQINKVSIIQIANLAKQEMEKNINKSKELIDENKDNKGNKWDIAKTLISSLFTIVIKNKLPDKFVDKNELSVVNELLYYYTEKKHLSKIEVKRSGYDVE